MMHEQSQSSGTPLKAGEVAPTPRLGHSRLFTVPTTPYSVFVHQSPVYVTSEMPPNKRRGRLSARPDRRPRMPFRPDAYPYANRHWTRKLVPSFEANTVSREES